MSGPFYGVCPTCGTRLTAPNYCAWCAENALKADRSDDDDE